MSRKKVEAALLAMDKAGLLTPAYAVEQARDPSHPLHDRFEWDDSIAGHEYRLAQARDLIASVRYKIVTAERTLRVPMYIERPGKTGRVQGYMAVSRVKRNRSLSVSAVMTELVRAEGCLKRAQGVAAAVGVDGEFEAALAVIHGLASDISSE